MAVLLVLFLAAGAQSALVDAPAPAFSSSLSSRDVSGYDR